jgi:hypothetical protein
VTKTTAPRSSQAVNLIGKAAIDGLSRVGLSLMLEDFQLMTTPYPLKEND